MGTVWQQACCKTRKVLQTISDDEVIGRVRSGDTGSYSVLAARYDSRLRGVAQRLLRSKAAAEDVVQGAHILALTHLDQYRGSGYFRWMYSIVRNEAHTHMRKEKRTFELGEFSIGQLSDRARTPEQQAVDTDVEQILTHAVETLPAAYRAAFRLREIEDLTVAETGERLGLSEACVRTRVCRARSILKKRLKQVLKRADLQRPVPDYRIAVPTSAAASPEIAFSATGW